MLTSWFFLILGLTILSFGAEFLVRGSSILALKLGVAPLVIGLTIVAFGTSAPELAVSIQSATSGNSSIALGNVVGSNIANIGLILGITAIISPISIDRQLIRKEIPLIIFCSFLMWGLLLDGSLGKLDGSLLVLGIISFLVYSYFQSKNDQPSLELLTANLSTESPTKVPRKIPTIVYIGLILAGIAMLIYGSTVFVSSAVDLARLFGMTEAVIGLTIVSIGTSVPELATALMAAYKRQGDIAVGNIIGSNLFNILAILGITALIRPISGTGFAALDFIVMIAFAVVLLPFAFTQLTICRREGVVLLSSYTAYMIYTAFIRIG